MNDAAAGGDRGLAAPGGSVPSPCVKVCRMEPPGNAEGDPALCAGCLRTIDEIAAWAQLADAGKRAVWAAIARRRARRAAAAGELSR